MGFCGCRVIRLYGFGFGVDRPITARPYNPATVKPNNPITVKPNNLITQFYYEQDYPKRAVFREGLSF